VEKKEGHKMKFQLQTNEHDGFKLSTQADSPEELKVVEELTKLLIAKIEKIKVTIGYDQE
jgi:hypothetical protein